MAYSKEVYEAVDRELNNRRLAADQRAVELRARMRQNPRVAELEAIMASSAGRLSRAILSGGDYQQELAAIRAQNLSAQKELAAILREAGEASGNFEPHYTCTACNDTGFTDGVSCICRKALLREQAAKELRRLTGMKLQSFDTLDVTFYGNEFDKSLGCTPREHMSDVLSDCRRYAESFDLDHPNLLLYGATGTGKTHVSLAIAAAACERGASVVYGSVQTLLHEMEKEHFGRASGDTEQTLIDCDLLVLDDLGTEFSSPFYTSALYTLINGRLQHGRPTVISTNLDATAIHRHYGEQIASRLMGNYEPLLFVGNDIRQQKISRRLYDN